MVWALMIGIPFLVLYAAGIPLMPVFVMYRRKHKLHTDKSTVSRFGFLYFGCEFVVVVVGGGGYVVVVAHFVVVV